MASLIVPDFTIFVFSSSCNSLFLVLLSPSISWLPILLLGLLMNRKRKQSNNNEAEKDIITCVTWTSYELPYREIILDSPSTVVNIRTFHRKTEVFSLSTETKKHTVFSWDCPFNFFKNLIFYCLIFCFIVWSFQLILL